MQIFGGVKEVYYGICASSQWNLKERELRNDFCYDKVTLQIDMIGRWGKIIVLHVTHAHWWRSFLNTFVPAQLKNKELQHRRRQRPWQRHKLITWLVEQGIRMLHVRHELRAILGKTTWNYHICSFSDNVGIQQQILNLPF